MPVHFLTPEQRANYGRYTGSPSSEDLTRYFYLGENDHTLIGNKRGDHNRLGFALQLTTARFIGTFLDDPTDVPDTVLQTLSRQLSISSMKRLPDYRQGAQTTVHIEHEAVA